MKKITRCKFRDVAFQFRMGAGFAGDVNRTHPASIEPCLQNILTPATAYGQAVLADVAGGTNTVRAFGAGDAAATLAYGVTVRPFPSQAAAGSTNAQMGLGAAAMPATGPIDVLRSGYILAQLNPGQASPTKGQAVMVQTAATQIVGGNTLTQGMFMTAATVAVATLDGRYTYNGPADANGIVEIAFNA